MLDIYSFIKQVLDKKQWTYERFAEEINKVREQANIEGKTTKQNISNYLNHTDSHHYLGVRQVVIWEKALGLPEDSLCNMVEQKKTVRGKRELERWKNRIRK